MKVTYLEQIENHMAWNGNMYCAKCGAHEYDIVEQLEPQTETPWVIRCPQCGAQTKECSTRETAFMEWKK